MPEGAVGASGAARADSHVEPQPARLDAGRIVVPHHQPGGLRFHGPASLLEKLGQERGDIGRRRMGSAPGRTQASPIRAVPVPFLGAGVAAARFYRRELCLHVYHVAHGELAQPLSRMVHLQRLQHGLLDQRADLGAGDQFGDPAGQQDGHAGIAVARTGLKMQRRPQRMLDEFGQRRVSATQRIVFRQLVRQSGNMGQQMPQRDILASVVRELRNELAQRIVQLKLAPVVQRHQRRGRNRLGDRTEQEHRAVAGRRPERAREQSVALPDMEYGGRYLSRIDRPGQHLARRLDPVVPQVCQSTSSQHRRRTELDESSPFHTSSRSKFQYKSYINSPPCSGLPISRRARRSTT